MARDAPHMGAIGGVRVHFASISEGNIGMEAAKKRRSSPKTPAMPVWEESGALMAAFAYEYASDPCFGHALETLTAGHEAPASQVDFYGSYNYLYPRLYCHLPDSARAFAHDLAAFSERWGLDLLPKRQGTSAVLDWCIAKSRNSRVRPDWFVSIFGFGGAMDEQERSVCVNLIDEWPIYREPREAAKKRLLARCAEAIDAEMSRIRDEADATRDATGQPLIIFPTTKPQRAEHLNWLYQRMAYRRPCLVIAKNEYRDEPTVRNPTDSIKSELGIAKIPAANEHFSPI